jgi:hypothetical protein
MGFDKGKSYKLVNGKFVERTPEELVALEQKRATYYSTAEPPTAEMAKARMPKSKELFIRITMSQADRLLKLNPPAYVTIFLLLSLESFKAHGQPFVWPTSILHKWGFGRWTQWQVMGRLAEAGLISIRRVSPKKPPRVTIL